MHGFRTNCSASPAKKKNADSGEYGRHTSQNLIAISWSFQKETMSADRLVSNATNVPRALVQVARVGAEKNHVCIYISAGINHSTEKSQHKTQTRSRARDSTSVEYAMAVCSRCTPLPKNAFIIHQRITNATVYAFTPAFTLSALTRLIDDVFDSKSLVPMISCRHRDAFFSSIVSIDFIIITISFSTTIAREFSYISALWMLTMIYRKLCR